MENVTIYCNMTYSMNVKIHVCLFICFHKIYTTLNHFVIKFCPITLCEIFCVLFCKELPAISD